jgi:hypothetical protein
MLYPDFFQNKHQKIQKKQKRQNERFLKGFETVNPDEEAKNDQNAKNYGVRKKKPLYPESEVSHSRRSRLQNGDRHAGRAFKLSVYPVGGSRISFLGRQVAVELTAGSPFKENRSNRLEACVSFKFDEVAHW